MKTLVFSPDSLKTTSADLVINNPQLATLFEQNNIEYCCHGDVPLNQFLKDLKISENEFLDKMNQTVDKANLPIDYPDTQNPVEVIHYILEIYHKPLPKMFEDLGKLINKAADHHGPTKPFTLELKKHFDTLRDDITNHLWKEEKILFPMIIDLYKAKLAKKSKPILHCGTVKNPITQMEFEHDVVGGILKLMENTMAPHQLAETGCTTLKTIKKSFDYLKIEIHKHIHMENYILHPLARTLEE